MSMTDCEIMEFAVASARMAFDQRKSSDYTPAFTAFDSYQDNVVDTMTEHRVTGAIYHEALAAYVNEYQTLALVELHERSGGEGSQTVYANIAAVAAECGIEAHVLEGMHFDMLDASETNARDDDYRYGSAAHASLGDSWFYQDCEGAW